jgi:iron complex transport system permease protein
MKHRSLLTIWLFSLLIVVFGVSLLVGKVWIDPFQVARELWTGKPRLAGLIVTDLRLPRAVLACLVGASLGLSGAVLQGMTRNPLAEPGLLGVSSGAAFGAVLAIYFGIATLFDLTGPILGMTGAFAASALTFALARKGSAVTLVLAGAAVSCFASACISLALNLAPNPYAAYEISRWLLGSLSDKSWKHVLLILPFVGAGIAILATTGRALNALSLGETQAQSLGVNLNRLRILVILGTALAVGASTSVTGAIGFIGLVAPHIVRPFLGHEPRRILLPSALLGAVLLLASDIATRFIWGGPEIEIGVFTSLLGTPFFFWLVVQMRRNTP